MPRRKKSVDFVEDEVEEDDYYPGSLEYGMDDYDDPTDHMTPEEIEELAQYIDMIQNGGGGDGDDDDDSDYEPPKRGRSKSRAPPPLSEDLLYPDEPEGDSDDE